MNMMPDQKSFGARMFMSRALISASSPLVGKGATTTAALISILQFDLTLGDHSLPLLALGFQNIGALLHGRAARLDTDFGERRLHPAFCSVARRAPLSLLNASAGTPAGAKMPSQRSTSKPLRPASSIV